MLGPNKSYSEFCVFFTTGNPLTDTFANIHDQSDMPAGYNI